MNYDIASANSLFVSASLIASFLGGVIMLFAPCCITLMLPAYFGSVFKARTKVVLMTLIFALGVASVMLPIVLGARFLVSFFSDYHFYTFAAGSILMIAVGALSLFDKKIKMPFASKIGGFRSESPASGLSVYLLGVASGVSSSCCAPVLLGATALAAISPTILQAAAVGLSYTFGIVFPLFILSLFFEKGWEKFGARFQQKIISFSSFKVKLSNFISFLIFTLTGVLFLFLSFTNRLQMGESAVNFTIYSKKLIGKISSFAGLFPYSEYVFGLLLILIVLYFIRHSRRGK